MKKLRGRPDNNTLPLHRERLLKVGPRGAWRTLGQKEEQFPIQV